MRKRPSSGVFKTSTAATGTCGIVAGKASYLLIRAELNAYWECIPYTHSVPALKRCDDLPATITQVPVAASSKTARLAGHGFWTRPNTGTKYVKIKL